MVRTDCFHISPKIVTKLSKASESFNNLSSALKLSKNLLKYGTFIENARDRIHTRTLIHSNDSCQIWTGSVKKGSNYGQIKYKDPKDGRYKTKGVHRVALMVSDKIKRLDIQANLVASHFCNNSLSVNVDHFKETKSASMNIFRFFIFFLNHL